MTSIINLSNIKARQHLLSAESYSNVDLPKYVDFQPILDAVDQKLTDKRLSDWYQSSFLPHDDEKVNYRLLGNKDGSYGWRPYELVHPALYVDIVHLLTTPENWQELCERFKQFEKYNLIKCRSMPGAKQYKKTQKGTQILTWWEGIEQEAIKTALSFSHVYDADISNCYGSIYTHSISWALHGKTDARADRNTKSLLGSKIDEKMQTMRYRQTNGIPQGNTVSDIIAELVLGYADLLITDKIKKLKLSSREFKVLRYRDDYKIFTNQPEQGKKILKIVSEVLSDLGMHLNTSKTKESSDAVIASVKEDKIDELFVTPRENNYSKWLLQIYATIKRHPNSGKVVRQLNLFHEKLFDRHERHDKLASYENAEVMMSMIVNIAIRNPKYYNWSVAIISILLEYTAKSKRKPIASKIVKRFESVPNTGLLDIWLQRVTFSSHPERNYNEPFCKLVTTKKYPGNDHIWSSDWLAEANIKAIIRKTPIVNRAELTKLKPVMDRAETDNFRAQPT